MNKKPVVVIGGMNMDLVAKARAFPRPGETITGEGFYRGLGGKGANQAIMVARMGVPVNFIGRVGDDDFGAEMIATMRKEGVGVEQMKPLEQCSSGIAMIFVDSEAQNEIIVVPGANMELTSGSILEAEQTIAEASLLVTVFENPMKSVEEAIRIAAKHGVPVLVNPAPAEKIDPSLLKHIDIMVPNETEAEALTGVSVDANEFPDAAIEKLKGQGVENVIITLGDKGCALLDSKGSRRIPPYKVTPIDTTAAGDAFMGALAGGYHLIEDLDALARFASAAGALAVTEKGSQAALPTRREIEGFLSENDPELLEQLNKSAG